MYQIAIPLNNETFQFSSLVAWYGVLYIRVLVSLNLSMSILTIGTKTVFLCTQRTFLFGILRHCNFMHQNWKSDLYNNFDNKKIRFQGSVAFREALATSCHISDWFQVVFRWWKLTIRKNAKNAPGQILDTYEDFSHDERCHSKRY